MVLWMSQIEGKFTPKSENPLTAPSHTKEKGVTENQQLLNMIGAGDGTRTHDVQLGKLTFYH